MTPVRVQAGRDLTREGETGREFLIIVDGTATVRRQGRVVATLGTNVSRFGNVKRFVCRCRFL
jgi:5-deoxy-D-glucuronate isomerase